MNRREQILVIAAAVSVVFAFFQYAGRLPSTSTPVPPAERINVKALVTLAAAGSPDKTIKANIDTIQNGLNAPWPQAVFYDKGSREDKSGTTAGNSTVKALDPKQYVYSGFLQMNDENIAIINGIDYKDGDLMDGYGIKAILPDRIILTRHNQQFILRQEKMPTETGADAAPTEAP